MTEPRSKPSLVDRVDRLLTFADRALDRVRKTPRRRIEVVPEPPVPTDPFAPAPVVAPSPAEKPLGDPGLPAQIYGRRTCDASARALALLRDHTIVARMIDIDDPDHRELERRLIRETKRYATPWVYWRGQYLGGFEELAAKVKSGD